MESTIPDIAELCALDKFMVLKLGYINKLKSALELHCSNICLKLHFKRQIIRIRTEIEGSIFLYLINGLKK